MDEKQKETFVDRIDTERIKRCSHGVEVTRKELLGITIFYHPDGQPCSVLNSLRLDGATINREDAQLTQAKAEADKIIDKIDDPIVYSRLSTDPALVKRLARELDEETDVKRLEGAFLKIAYGKNAAEVFRAIGAALGSEKNIIVLKNVVAIFGKQYKEGSVEGLQHLYPLVIEAQQVAAKKKKAKTEEA